MCIHFGRHAVTQQTCKADNTVLKLPGALSCKGSLLCDSSCMPFHFKQHALTVANNNAASVSKQGAQL